MTATTGEEVEEEVAAAGLLPADRYIACNRFTVRDGAGPRFEKRWAERKSSIATLEGFKFFTLLRRCDDMPDVSKNDGSLKVYPEGTPDYMSMTWWQNRKTFNSWRTGFAFKEAHGGGSLAGFLGAMLGSMMVLKDAPLPAMFEGLVAESVSGGGSPIVLKGRNAEGKAEADGVEALPAECFVAMNRFNVKAGCEKDFETIWQNRESTLKETKGFVAFTVLRAPNTGSKATPPGGPFGQDGINYSTCSVWDSKESWMQWFADSKKEGGSHKPAAPREGPPLKDLLNGPPSPLFWDGLLALESKDGA